MEIYERIRYLRKDFLKMTQEDFGAALGVNRSVIKNIELNNLARPEQKEPLYRLICEKFNVNYEWLTAGEGEMLVEYDDANIEAVVREYGLDDTTRTIFAAYVKLPKEKRAPLNEFVKVIARLIMDEDIRRVRGEVLNEVGHTYMDGEVAKSLINRVIDSFNRISPPLDLYTPPEARASRPDELDKMLSEFAEEVTPLNEMDFTDTEYVRSVIDAQEAEDKKHGKRGAGA